MNILIFSWRDIKHPLAGGAEQVMHEHAKGWIQAGHRVKFFTARYPGCSSEEAVDGIQIIRRSHRYLGVQLAAFFYYQKNKSQIDLVVDEFHGLPFFTPLYVKKHKFAVIQETARKVWFLNPLPWPINWIVGAVGYVIEPIIFLIYMKIPFMTGSQSAKQDVIKMGVPEKKITVVPHGVIVPKFQISNSKFPIKTIVYLGILSKDKGIEDALKCFSILNKKGRFNFWVVGKSDTETYGDKLRNLTGKLSLKGNIKFWGFVSQNKKFDLLSKAHILINPSVHEGWGLVNIEANSMGTPVISYRSAGLVDSIKEGTSGLICNQNTPEQLAKLTMELLSDEKKYRNLSKGAKIWSKNFSWEKSRKLSLSLIEQIANTK